MDQIELHIKGQTRRQTVDIVFVGVAALWLQEEQVTKLVGETHELVLNARAVAGADAGDLAGVHRRLVKVVPDDLLGLRCRVGHPAGHLFAARGPAEPALAGLFHVEQVLRIPGVVKGKQGGLSIALLFLQSREVNAPSQNPRRGPGLEALKFDAGLQQAARKRFRTEIPQASAFVLVLTHVHQSAEEGSGRDDHGLGHERDIQIGPAADDLAVFEDQSGYRRLEYLQIRLKLQRVFQAKLIGLLVALGPR